MNFKQYTTALSAVIFLLVLLTTSCTNTTTVGNDLLGGDLQDLTYSEDFTLKTYTVEGDSVRTYSQTLSAQLPKYYFGTYNDPVFGKVKSSIYAQVSMNAAFPNFQGGTLDSVVLVLPYEVGSNYGAVNSSYDLEVSRLVDSVNTEMNFYSDTSFMTDMMSIANYSFVPQNEETDSLMIEFPRNDTLGTVTARTAPQLRIPIQSGFENELFEADTMYFRNDTKFTEFLKGMKITSTSENEGIFAFNIRDNSSAGLFVYYHTDTTKVFYRFPFASSDLKMTTYDYDYENSMVETFVQTEGSGDSLFFLQGFSGVSNWIEITEGLDVLKQGDVTINKAELVFNVAALSEDNTAYTAPPQILLLKQNEDGQYEYIEDLSRSITSGQISTTLFGGDLQTDTDEKQTYSMNVTAYLQNVVDGKEDGRLKMLINQRQYTPNRAVFYGGGHSSFAPKLRVYYTKF